MFHYRLGQGALWYQAHQGLWEDQGCSNQKALGS